jgi:hypothetical protein
MALWQSSRPLQGSLGFAMQQRLWVFLFVIATRNEAELESDMCDNDLATTMEQRKLALEIVEVVSLTWLLDKIVDSVAKVRKYQGKRRECGSRQSRGFELLTSQPHSIVEPPSVCRRLSRSPLAAGLR